MNKYFIILAIFGLLSSCNNNTERQQTKDEAQTEDNTAYDSSFVEPSISTDYSTSTESQNQPQPKRQNAIQDAFNIGRAIGYQDGLKGVNDCALCAASYTDDWVKQSFIQGYELGQAEAGANGSTPDVENDYEEFESYDDEY